jgi:putative DNA-invertase from lambdoid prophage Rac
MTVQGKRAAVYARVSSAQQHLENQRPILIKLAEARGLDIVHVFEEKISSTKRRPALEAMLLSAHRREWDCLLIFSLDRLGRSLKQNLDVFMRLDSCGVRVISEREPWLDSGGPVRDLLLSIFSWVAQQEREQIAARCRLGLQRAKASGTRLGRPPVHFSLVRAVQLREAGVSLRKAARELGVGASTLSRALRAHDEVERLQLGCAENVGCSDVA